MNDFLDRIVSDIKERKKEKFNKFSPSDFIKKLPNLPPSRQKTILQNLNKKFFLIAECKKASPSKGLLCPNYDPVRIARSYEAGGASAISVLTEEKFFQGSPQHLEAVRKVISLPILWKDFVVHKEQIAQARLLGADLVLLIFRILHRDKIHQLINFTLKCGLIPLVEVFMGDDPSQIIYVMAKYHDQCLIGINNRDLDTFRTDLSHSKKIYHNLTPLHKNFNFISESGIETSVDINLIKKIGFRGALVGESLIKQEYPESAVKQLIIG